MFKSKKRAILIPQSEHARLAGQIAYYWGNAEVKAPPLDHAAFASGVTNHDRGYGRLDTMAIGETEELIWLATQRRGIQMHSSDPVADTVSLMHIRRLLSHVQEDDARSLLALADERILRNIRQTSFTHQAFEQADTIAELCDDIAFKFCFEEPVRFERSVSSQGAMLEIEVRLDGAGRVQLHPWPLSVPELRGCILGYNPPGYPDHLDPMLVEFQIVPTAKVQGDPQQRFLCIPT